VSNRNQRSPSAGATFTVVLLFGLVHPAEAARRKEVYLRMYEIGCTAPASPAALPAAWLVHRNQIEDCPVLTADRRHVLTIRTVRVPKGTIPPAPLPAPLLLNMTGAVVGVLPGVWPGPDPDIISLFFTRWRDDFPQRIEMKTLGPTTDLMRMSATFHPPLVWNVTKGRYQQGK
jgi:hypothetical protein